MDALPPFYYSVTLRSGGPGAVHITAARLDRSGGRMVFEHVADLLGDPSDPREAMDLLAYGAEILRLRVHDLARRLGQPPAGG